MNLDDLFYKVTIPSTELMNTINLIDSYYAGAGTVGIPTLKNKIAKLNNDDKIIVLFHLEIIYNQDKPYYWTI